MSLDQETPLLQPPSTDAQRRDANLEVVRLLKSTPVGAELDQAGRQTLAKWSGWGSLPELFKYNPRGRYQVVAEELQKLMTEDEFDAARKSTMNAHYTPSDIATRMWQVLTDLGFESGTAVEPGCGPGVFLSVAPDAVDVTGVEVEPLTARIATLLNPRHNIVTQGFEKDLAAASSGFDAAIGNVPFGDFSLVDPVHNRQGKLSIHNHFILKALAMVRPGGVAAFITSAYTLDSEKDTHRKLIGKYANLIGVVRLPSGAFFESAGTKVVTDILVFRRRKKGETSNISEWSKAEPFAPDVNSWGRRYRNSIFSGAASPAIILGDEKLASGMYGRAEYVVESTTEDLAADLDEALTEITNSAKAAGSTFDVKDQSAADLVEFERISGSAEMGPFVVADDGAIMRESSTGARVPAKNAKGEEMNLNSGSAEVAELVALIKLREATVKVLSTQEDAEATDGDIAASQAALGEAYDAYVEAFGPINRVKVSYGKVDPTTGEPKINRRRPKLGGFRSDPYYWVVAALEFYDEEANEATKAPIFTERVIGLEVAAGEPESASDALAMCLNQVGRVDMDMIAGLLGKSVEEVAGELGDLVYFDPERKAWETASIYLSGDVRKKLSEAAAAAESDAERFGRNVTALEAIQPPDLTPEQIDARLGAAWIPAADVTQFLNDVICGSRHYFRGVLKAEHVNVLASWILTVPTELRGGAATVSWGTPRMDAYKIIDATLNQRPIVVYDTVTSIDGTERKVVNQDETLEAQDKQAKIQTAFLDWIWSDHERSDRLSTLYNERFNSFRSTEWDGSHLSFPGMSPTWHMRPHQANAVWRCLQSESTLLAHVVGAGKTAVMVSTALEERRLGRSKKPCMVVPNHLLEQAARDALHIYPGAKILVADKDSLKGLDGRKRFVAMSATGDWDLVIMTESTFTRIGMRPATQAEHLNRIISKFREAAEAITDERDKKSIKRLEAQIQKLTTRHEVLLNADSKDDGICWELTGIDRLLIDEAHFYKNLGLPTKSQGVLGRASQRAEDLDMKLHWSRDRFGLGPVFATGTPISNAIAECYVMMSYLMPERLDEMGMGMLDSWLGTFAETVTQLELSPEGKRLRLNSRIARYRNVPELVKMFLEAADLQLDADKLGIKRPKSSVNIVTVKPTEETLAFVDSLVRRADDVRNRVVTPEEDNMLTVCMDGRKVALDPTLVGIGGGMPKLEEAADAVAAKFQKHEDETFLDPRTGKDHPTKGGFQLVFLDLGTPGSDGTKTYGRFRDLLVERGIPHKKIAFAQDAKTDAKKTKLHAACRDGRISVMVGSTGTCGTGTNVQDRMVAIHHLDAPWKPSEIEQRNGRGDRQGNQSQTLEINFHLTEQTFDAFLFQTVERKSRFIDQIVNNDPTVRTVEEIDSDSVLTFAALKSAATGDDRIVKLAELDGDVARLRRLRVAHKREAGRRASEIRRLQDQSRDLRRVAKSILTVAAVIDDYTDELLDAAVAAAAARALEAVDAREFKGFGRSLRSVELASFGRFGLKLHAKERGLTEDEYTFWLELDLPGWGESHLIELPKTAVTGEKISGWLGRNLSYTLLTLDEVGNAKTQRADVLTAEADSLHDESEWPDQERLEEMETEADRLRKEIEADMTNASPDPAEEETTTATDGINKNEAGE